MWSASGLEPVAQGTHVWQKWHPLRLFPEANHNRTQKWNHGHGHRNTKINKNKRNAQRRRTEACQWGVALCLVSEKCVQMWLWNRDCEAKALRSAGKAFQTVAVRKRNDLPACFPTRGRVNASWRRRLQVGQYPAASKSSGWVVSAPSSNTDRSSYF